MPSRSHNEPAFEWTTLVGLLCCALCSSFAFGEGNTEEDAVYIGVQACAKCHEGLETGHQFSRWRLSAHAKAYAALSMPEAEEITKLSGITEEPQKAKMCLGCHATAADVEEWRRDDAFRVNDGLQCEKCHGPGSEYATTRIMSNRKRAVENGLKIPSKDACMMCHRVKGSHEAVLKKKPFDIEKAWKAIAHHYPEEEDPRLAEQEDLPPPERGISSGKFKVTGVAVCAKCHRGPKRGFQFSQWRQGPHAKAYATLATPKAYEIATKMKLKGEPQKNESCLACHTTGADYDSESFLPGFDPRDGVQCESCHGPGSEYSPEAVMLDKVSSRQAGLLPVNRRTCKRCHENAHGKPFDYEKAVKQIAHPTKPPKVAEAAHYKTPLNLALTPDGKELWITCEADRCVIVADAATRKCVAQIEVGGQPTDVTFNPDGSRAYVTNRLDDSLSVVDVAARKLIKTIPVGDEPHGVIVDSKGKYLYVLNTSTDSISVIDAVTLNEVKRLSASRAPWSLDLSPDGRQIYVTNTLSRFVPPRTATTATTASPSMSEVTIIDAERAVVENRVVVPAANLLQGVAWHPSGEYAVITLNRTKNLVPMTRLLQGWTITNGIGIVRKDGRVDQVLLDQPHLSFPDPADVDITPDGRYALVTSSGSNRVAVVDLKKLTEMLGEATPYERERVFPNHLNAAQTRPAV